jgi:hypothetical protein
MHHVHQARTLQELAWMTGRPLGSELERNPGFMHRVAWAALRRERPGRAGREATQADREAVAACACCEACESR